MTDTLKCVDMLYCKPLATPLLVPRPVDASAEFFFYPTKYRSLDGGLQCLMVTHTDLSFTVNPLCQHMHSPTMADWVALKRVLCNVKGTLDFGLCLKKSPCVKIHAFFFNSN